ncbi:flavin reductase [Acetobacter oeni]
MALLAAAVSIITTDGGKGRHGFTASAVCSVSDDPPTLLVCINRSASTHPHILEHGTLAVNVLTGEQKELSSVFSDRSKTMEDRFASATWTRGLAGAPLLAHALASFDCIVDRTIDAGTHTVVLASVVDIALSANAPDSLVWFSRQYATLPRSV